MSAICNYTQSKFVIKGRDFSHSLMYVYIFVGVKLCYGTNNLLIEDQKFEK